MNQAWIRIKKLQGLGVLAGIFLLAVLFSPETARGNSTFLNVGNLTDMLRAIAPVAIMGLGMTFVILTGGIDLSVGSILALSAVLNSILLTEWHPGIPPQMHILLSVLLAIAAGGLVGMLNGALISRLRIQPFIITLASMIGIRGFNRWLTDNEKIGLGLGEDVAGIFGNVFSEKSVMIGTFIVIAAIFIIILERTVLGRYIRALGDNPVAARYAGLPIHRVRVAVYSLMGMLAGVAGVLHCARTTTGDPNAGIAFELDVIAVVVIGGTNLAGGKGSVWGTINGALIIGVLTNILGLNNVDSNMQLMLKAVIIVIAVALQRRKEE